MSFYENKRKAALLVDEMLIKNKSIPEIELSISTKFGFGRKFIMNRIQLLKEVGGDLDVFREEDGCKDQGSGVPEDDDDDAELEPMLL